MEMDEKPRSTDDLGRASDDLLARKLEYAFEHIERCVRSGAEISADMYRGERAAIMAEQRRRLPLAERAKAWDEAVEEGIISDENSEAARRLFDSGLLLAAAEVIDKTSDLAEAVNNLRETVEEIIS